MFLSHLTHAVSRYGLIGLFALVGLEALGLPLPGESALILASASAARGELNIYGVIGATTLGAILGDNIGYLIGRRFGRGLILRYGSRIGITAPRYDRVAGLIARRGFLIVMLARFVALLRQLNGLVAGAGGMPWPRFFAANAIGAALWATLWCTVGYRFGHLVRLPWIWHHLTLIGSVIVLALLATILVLRLRGRRGTDAGARE